MKYKAVAVLFMLAFSTAAYGLFNRDLECEHQPSGRAQEICKAVENAMEWSWTGHAIISPRFRINFAGIRSVYCSEAITSADTELLVTMHFNSDVGNAMEQPQLNNGTGWLLLMLGRQALENFPDIDELPDKSRRIHAQYLQKIIALDLEETSSSIFNPLHDSYILRDGCP